jgi:single-strand selective monofunctional uracil DNA glycosylase
MSHTTAAAPDLAGRIMSLYDSLAADLDRLRFAAPVAAVYDPLVYAREPWRRYVERFLAGRPGRVLWLGMNPGPFGMAQTGVPFGAIPPVRDWMGIDCPVAQPPAIHPKRPIQGFACPRIEGSGKRLWGLFSRNWPNPDAAFTRHAVVNWCPLVFMDGGGANLTPDKLPRAERQAVAARCDRALAELIALLEPRALVGVGAFAANRLAGVLAGGIPGAPPLPALPVVTVLHPSPASPRANKDWEGEVRAVLEAAGLWP